MAHAAAALVRRWTGLVHKSWPGQADVKIRRPWAALPEWGNYPSGDQVVPEGEKQYLVLRPIKLLDCALVTDRQINLSERVRFRILESDIIIDRDLYDDRIYIIARVPHSGQGLVRSCMETTLKCVRWTD